MAAGSVLDSRPISRLRARLAWLILLACAGLLVSCATPGPTTYYVRVDGGSAAQCTGATDTAYPGQGDRRACAWRHPFEALPPGGPARIAGGDTLIIDAGSYQIGRGAPGSDVLAKCSAEWPWDCHPAPLPSGPAPDRPTRVLGAGWDRGCARPPELWGSERAATVLDLSGSSNVEVACLELTDHSSCIEFHDAGLQSERCERDHFPYGAWAGDGINAADSAHVRLADLHIHGLAHDGVRAARIRDWTLERVRIVGNGWTGWNGDLGDAGSSNSGQLIFRHVEIAWNGCGERWPGAERFGCWGQQEGGYGDGLGTGATSGDWLFEDIEVHHNTQDGLDLLHANADARISFRRVHAYANAGNQIKASGSLRVEDSVLDGDCAALARHGLPVADLCRAYGNTVSVNPAPHQRADVVNNDIRGQGDCLIEAGCRGEDCRSASVAIRDNRLSGALRSDPLPEPKLPCSVWVGPELRGADVEFTGNQVDGVRSTGCPERVSRCARNHPAGAPPAQ